MCGFPPPSENTASSSPTTAGSVTCVGPVVPVSVVSFLLILSLYISTVVLALCVLKLRMNNKASSSVGSSGVTAQNVSECSYVQTSQNEAYKLLNIGIYMSRPSIIVK